MGKVKLIRSKNAEEVFKYPKIGFVNRESYLELSSCIRLKRDGVWYDLIVRDIYDTNKPSSVLDIFIDKLVCNKLYWKVGEKGSYSFLNPSENQEDSFDDLLEPNRINRLKKDPTTGLQYFK